MKRARPKGSVLTEFVIVLGAILIPSIGFQIEVIRAAQYQVLVGEMAFRLARLRALGVSGSESRRRVEAQVLHGLSESERLRFSRTLYEEEGRSEGRGFWVRVRYRYPGVFPFLHERFQLTKRCLFSC